MNAIAAKHREGSGIDQNWGEDASSSTNKKRSRGLGEERVTDLDSASLSQFLDAEQKETKSSHSSSVLWKRLEPLEGETGSCRVVDALLENLEANDGPQNKRRKLTLLGPQESTSRIDLSSPHKSSSVRRKPPLKVLDPLTRMVDDSLQEVHSGIKPISQHYQFITMDPVLAVHDTTKWLQWCHSSGGNILHACALWNEVEVAGELLQIPNLAGGLCESLDGDGRTPYEVAQLSGHDSVCEVLEAFGGDTTNYVYDIFCMDESTDPHVDDNRIIPTSVELTSGVAYWTPDGELMLEADDGNIAAMNDDDQEEIDSNCEESYMQLGGIPSGGHLGTIHLRVFPLV